MAKFKYDEKCILRATYKEVVINKVITNFGSKTTKYELKSGEEVTDNDLEKISFAKAKKTTQKELNNSYKKGKEKPFEKNSLPPVKQGDKESNNQEVTKSNNSDKKE